MNAPAKIPQIEPSEFVLRKYLWKQLVTWITILGAIASILLAIIEYTAFAIFLAIALIIILAYTAASYIRRVHTLESKLQGFKEAWVSFHTATEGKIQSVYNQFDRLHEIIHQTRNQITSPQLYQAIQSHDVRDTINTTIIQNILNQLAYLFIDLLGIDCVASVMFPEAPDSEVLQTALWSENAKSERIEHPSRIIKGHGIAGQVFTDGGVRVINDIQKNLESEMGPKFTPEPPNYRKFYNSFISAPFKVNGEIQGIIHLDSLGTNVFDEKFKYLVQLGGDLIAAAIQLDLFLRSISK